MIRSHLEEARRNKAVGDLVMRFKFEKGGLRASKVGVVIEYEFVNNMPAV